jgi:hypothetical protein
MVRPAALVFVISLATSLFAQTSHVHAWDPNATGASVLSHGQTIRTTQGPDIKLSLVTSVVNAGTIVGTPTGGGEPVTFAGVRIENDGTAELSVNPKSVGLFSLDKHKPLKRFMEGEVAERSSNVCVESTMISVTAGPMSIDRASAASSVLQGAEPDPVASAALQKEYAARAAKIAPRSLKPATLKKGEVAMGAVYFEPIDAKHPATLEIEIGGETFTFPVEVK